MKEISMPIELTDLETFSLIPSLWTGAWVWKIVPVAAAPDALIASLDEAARRQT